MVSRMSITVVHTAASIRALLASNPRAVERAIVALLARQTADERSAEMTVHRNGVGFNAADAKRLTYVAKFLGEGKHLRTETCLRYLPRVSKYAAQLAEIANENTRRRARLQAELDEVDAETEAA